MGSLAMSGPSIHPPLNQPCASKTETVNHPTGGFSPGEWGGVGELRGSGREPRREKSNEQQRRPQIERPSRIITQSKKPEARRPYPHRHNSNVEGDGRQTHWRQNSQWERSGECGRGSAEGKSRDTKREDPDNGR